MDWTFLIIVAAVSASGKETSRWARCTLLESMLLHLLEKVCQIVSLFSHICSSRKDLTPSKIIFNTPTVIDISGKYGSLLKPGNV